MKILLRGLAGGLFLRHPLLERADLFGRPAILLIGLLQPAAHRLQLGVQPEEFVLRRLHGDCFRLPLCVQLSELLLEGGAFFLEAALSLVQLGGGLCPSLLGSLAGGLFLRHPLLERADLFGRPAILLIGLLQPAAHRLQLGVQPEEFVLRRLHGDCFRLPLCVQLSELLLEGGAFFLEAALSLVQLGGGLCQCLLGSLAGGLFLRHPLLQRSNLFRDRLALLVRLLQPTAHRLQLGVQPEEFVLRRLQSLLGCLARRLFLRHPLLDDCSLLGDRFVLLVRLLQASTHYRQFAV